MFTVVNPATEKNILEIESDDRKSIEAKFLRAKIAQKEWQKKSVQERIGIIQKWNALINHHGEKLAQVLTAETGKPIVQARSEIKSVSVRVDFFTNNVEAILRPVCVSEEKEATQEQISYEPLGAVANISAWNYPYFVGANVFIPALLMGNSVLYKASEFASMTGYHIAKLMHEAGVPEDVFVLVAGVGEVGEILLEQKIDGVFFTGSYGTGVKIHEKMRGRMIPVQLELGGKDPTYVCEDVDIEKAAESLAEGAFYNTGQSCCSVERIYVHHSIYVPFLERFVQSVRSFVVGDPAEEKTFIGPLSRKAQINVLEKQVADAKAQGGRILLGAERLQRAGYFFAPTVIADAHHGMLCMREESFGPIIGVQKVQNDEEAVRLMNDTDYGLTAGVYCQASQRARHILSQIDAGTVYWNCCDRVSPRLPWTGRKNSGVGSTLSLEGIRAFGKLKSWHLRLP